MPIFATLLPPIFAVHCTDGRHWRILAHDDDSRGPPVRILAVLPAAEGYGVPTSAGRRRR